MEAISLLAARLGARAANFGAILPTSAEDFALHSLSEAEEHDAEREASELSRVFKMPVRVPFVLYRPSSGAHCYPLAGKAMNVDHLGRLTLCGNLSFFRGGECNHEVVGDAASDPKGLVERLAGIQRETLAARDTAIEACARDGRTPDAFLSSPCLSCLKRFDKSKWAPPTEEARA
jgi:hypothetical protein